MYLSTRIVTPYNVIKRIPNQHQLALATAASPNALHPSTMEKMYRPHL
jgi:hypothetical protein